MTTLALTSNCCIASTSEISLCTQPNVALLRELSFRVRTRCLETTYRSQFGHIGPDFSATDLLCTLFLTTLRFPSKSLCHPDRDRFILSKGHAALALYCVLIELGWWSPEILDFYGRKGGSLGGHPSCANIGIEACSGSLGHGLPFAVGAALAAKLEQSERKTFVLVGDGELQEGSNWEAAMLGATHRLDSLTVIVDRNGLQQGRGTEEVNQLGDLAGKWRAFGWVVTEIDGHDHSAICACLNRLPFSAGQPNCIIAKTVKGKGVSFMENNASWHHRLPSKDETNSALRELSETAML
ncbi:transketolase [Photorhabdus akhurstii]|uniref:transketolase n=1 Tax=Photorhabdus akhurstii TaxID=171438 RepID=UPI000D44E98B|nr:transketolase [Photorhabdus luminescens]